MGLIEGRGRRHAQKAPLAPLGDERVAAQRLGLCLCDVFEPAVGETARLAEVGLLEPFVDGEGDRKERSKQHCCQGDGCDGDEVPAAAGKKTLPGQMADTFSI